jgi:hypothetical protein
VTAGSWRDMSALVRIMPTPQDDLSAKNEIELLKYIYIRNPKTIP